MVVLVAEVAAVAELSFGSDRGEHHCMVGRTQKIRSLFFHLLLALSA